MGWLATRVRSRLWSTNDDWLCLFCGPRGSGKSLSALSLALAIDPTFKKERIIFSIEELMTLITEGKVKRGQAIIYDEIGVDASSKSSMSQTNKAVSFIIQTVRPYNLAVIFSTPSMDFVDSQIRKMFHTYIETWKGNFVNGRYARAKIFFLQYNPRISKLYFHTPKAVINGKKVDVAEIYFERPPLRWERLYAKVRKRYVMDLSKEQGTILSVKKDYLYREEAGSIVSRIIASPMRLKRYKVPWKNAPEGAPRWRFDADLISGHEGIGQKTAQRVKRMLEAKLLRR